MEFSIFEVILGLIVGFLFGILIGIHIPDRVTSEKLIRPELTIKVDNTGVADTTWTYIKP